MKGIFASLMVAAGLTGALSVGVNGAVGGSTDDGGSLVLVRHRQPVASIVLPDNADSWTQMAARWIQRYVEQSSGARLAIVPESQAPHQGILISVGHTKLAAGAGITANDLKYDGCRMTAKGNVLYLLGRDVASIGQEAVIDPVREPWGYLPSTYKGNHEYARIGAKGTCRAATFFLEEVVGVRWLVPTEEGTLVPPHDRIVVDADLDRSFEPMLMYHSNRTIYGDPRSEPAAYANNYRVAVKLYSAGGHTYPQWVPAEKYGKDHPEYFALLKGQRTFVGNHLCASNPDVRRIILENIESLFEAGYDLVQLGQSDGYEPCECDACRKLSNLTGAKDGSGNLAIEHPGEPMFDLALWVAEQCQPKYPGRYIHLLVYGPTNEPSKRIERFPDNVVMEYAGGGGFETVEKWTGRSATGGTMYLPWYWVDYGSGLGVKFSYTEAADAARRFRQIGIVGVHNAGGQMWGLMGPTYYVFGKMMGNPNLSEAALLAEYCNGLFGAAGKDMALFYERLHEQSDFDLLFSFRPASELLMLYYPPTRTQVLDGLLKKAEASARSEREKNWVKMARDEFDYLRLLSRALHLYRAYQINKTPENIEQVRAAVEEFDAYRTRIVNIPGEYAMRYFPGHGELAAALSQGQSGAQYGSDWRVLRSRVDHNNLAGLSVGLAPLCIDRPLTLDFGGEDLEPTFHLARTTATPPKIDGKLDELDWQNTPPVIMRGTATTEVRGLYDDRNLYISYICEDPRPGGPKGIDIVRDSPICFMDLIELFLDPESDVESSRYYHFLVGATSSAIMDLTHNFEGRNVENTKWDSLGFRYAFSWSKSEGRWYIELAVPFDDLNAARPKSGEVWMGNFARQGFSGLQQWSKGGTPGFCNPKSFGRIVFDPAKSPVNETGANLRPSARPRSSDGK